MLVKSRSAKCVMMVYALSTRQVEPEYGGLLQKEQLTVRLTPSWHNKTRGEININLTHYYRIIMRDFLCVMQPSLLLCLLRH